MGGMDFAENSKQARFGYGMLALMVAGTLFGGLLQNAVSTVLPDIMAETRVSVGMGQWLVSSFQLCLGVVIPLVAFFVRRFDIKRLFVAAMAFFTVGTFIVAAAQDFPLMFLGRILEDPASAMMVAVSLLDKKGERHEIPAPLHGKGSRLAVTLWVLLAAVMVGLYVFFN